MAMFPSFNQWKKERRLKKLFEAEVPDLNRYIGKKLKVKNDKGKEVVFTVRTIVGNKFKPHFYEINGEHLINALRFEAAILGVTDIPEQDFIDFENIEWEAVRNKDHDILMGKLEKNGIIF